MQEALLSSETDTRSHPAIDRQRAVGSFAKKYRALVGALLLSVMPMTVGAQEPAPQTDRDKATGTLMMVGGGNLPPEIDEYFVERAKGMNGKVVVIPAHEDADIPGQTIEDFWKHHTKVKVAYLLHAPDSDAANDPDFTKELDTADGVWFSGGKQERLKRYVGTRVEQKIRELLARGGVVGGTSAGASFMSRVMIVEGNPKAVVGRGLGLVGDAVVDQHFWEQKREERLNGVLQDHPKLKGLGIDEGTAVITPWSATEGSESWIKVLGRGNVRFYPAAADANASQGVRVLKGGDEVQFTITKVASVLPTTAGR